MRKHAGNLHKSEQWGGWGSNPRPADYEASQHLDASLPVTCKKAVACSSGMNNLAAHLPSQVSGANGLVAPQVKAGAFCSTMPATAPGRLCERAFTRGARQQPAGC
jgi:hypothetical protein